MSRGPVGPDVDLWPFSGPALEAALVQTRRATPGARHGGRALAPPRPTRFRPTGLSPRAEFYARLFLGTAPTERSPGRPRRLDPGPDLRRRPARGCCSTRSPTAAWRSGARPAEACHWMAQRHPGGFLPRHYTRLLPFLSDDDSGVRLRPSAPSRSWPGSGRPSRQGGERDLCAAVRGGRRRRRGGARPAGPRGGARYHDGSAGRRRRATPAEVQALEARRGELIQYVEQQAMRVGEEIHHEVLNTLTGYLATAIDEHDHLESKKRLDDLVNELRRIMNNLYPRDLETEGFLQTIRNRLRDTKAQMERRVPGCRPWSWTASRDHRRDRGRSPGRGLPRGAPVPDRPRGGDQRPEARAGTFIGVAVRPPATAGSRSPCATTGRARVGRSRERRHGAHAAPGRGDRSGHRYRPEHNGGTAVVVRVAPAATAGRARAANGLDGGLRRQRGRVDGEA